MAVYRGVIRGNTVVLSGPVELPEGAEVEVRPVTPPPASAEDRARGGVPSFPAGKRPD